MKPRKATQKTKAQAKAKTKAKAKAMKKPCVEFEDFVYDRKKKTLKVCIHQKGTYVEHSRYQMILHKELNKVLKQDMMYIDKEKHKEYKEFIKKYSLKYVKHCTKKKIKFSGYTPGELARIIIEDFDDKRIRFK